jgi:hypothetical protein
MYKLGLFFICLLVNKPLLAQGNFVLADWLALNATLKPMYVKAIMEQAAVNDVKLQLSPEFYQSNLDALAMFSAQHHYQQYFQRSVAQNLATIAVIHCDWHNTEDPLVFAQRYLGDKQLAVLNQLFPEAVTRLQNNCQ